MSKLNQREKSLHLRLKALKSITYFCPFCDNENRLSRQQKQVRGGVVISSPPSGNAAKLIYCLKDGPEGEGGGGGTQESFTQGGSASRSSPLPLSIYCLKEGPELGKNSRKYFTGRLRPKVQPLTLIYILSKGRPQAGKELKKVFYGEDPPKVLPLTFIYTISDRKGYPFRIPY